MSGDTKKAEKEFIHAVKVAPELLNSRILLAQYYIKNKKFQDAIHILKKGLKENPDDAILYNIIGAAYLGAQNIDKSITYFKKAIASDANFVLPYINLAFIYLSKNKKEEAIKEYKKVLELDDGNVTALLMMAKIMEADKKDKEALSYYTKAKGEEDSIAYLSLAGYYLRKKDNKRAIEVLDEALIVDQEDIKAMDMKGRIFLANNDYQEALSVYKNLKKVSPEIGAERMVDVYTGIGDYDRAIIELRGLLTRNSYRADLLGKMTHLHIKKKDYKEAEKTAKDIISLRPQSYVGYQFLAAVYLAVHKFQEAIEALKKAEELDPDNPESVYFYQAIALEMMGRKSEAVEKHQKTLRISPDYVPSLNNLAYLYAEGYGPIGEAVNLARRAKKFAPQDGRITDTLGWILFKTGDYEDALKNFIEATYYLPGEPTIRYHLGLTYLKKGMNDRAEEQLKNAIRLGRKNSFPGFEDTQKLLKGITQK